MRRPIKLRSLSSFTLIELLVVMVIIAILAALTLAAYTGVFKTAARARARSEITAISAALESYKTDNGVYPTPSAAVGFTSTNYTSAEPNGPGLYEDSSAFLYQSLTGQTNYGTAALAGTKIYETFTRSQLGNNDPTDEGTPIYIKDPFGNSYGYFAGITGNAVNVPVSGSGLFDLWSTGGDVTGNTAIWVENWNNN